MSLLMIVTHLWPQLRLKDELWAGAVKSQIGWESSAVQIYQRGSQSEIGRSTRSFEALLQTTFRPLRGLASMV